MPLIPQFHLKLEPISEEAANLKPFRWAGKDIGSRNYLGGSPKWIHEMENPGCDSCGSLMSFYGQLDSLNDEYCLADCGVIFVFICFDCFEPKAIFQSM